eukprot:scaffold129211_cov37-Prasinocladus_malaysianus.AAC.1
MKLVGRPALAVCRKRVPTPSSHNGPGRLHAGAGKTAPMASLHYQRECSLRPRLQLEDDCRQRRPDLVQRSRPLVTLGVGPPDVAETAVGSSYALASQETNY